MAQIKDFAKMCNSHVDCDGCQLVFIAKKKWIRE